MTWPRCEAAIEGLFDEPLECVLPQHHERDGQLEHQDADGTRWSRKHTMADGTEWYE